MTSWSPSLMWMSALFPRPQRHARPGHNQAPILTWTEGQSLRVTSCLLLPILNEASQAAFNVMYACVPKHRRTSELLLGMWPLFGFALGLRA
jgi:hypothetical protein